MERWGANEDERGSEEVWRQGLGKGVLGRRAKGARKRGLHVSEEMTGIVIRGKGELSWKNKRRTKSCFCRGRIGFVMRSESDGKKGTREGGLPNQACCRVHGDCL
jgi:hypothetical protein